MTQIWKGDTVVPVTPLEVKEKENAETLLSEFKEGELVKVTGTSRGRGFQGVVKRHGFHGGPRTHGQKDRLRAPGSIGATAPQRVLPGKKMGGHMGVNTVTVKNLVVAAIKIEQKQILVRGAVPGHSGSKVIVQKT